MRKGVFAIGLVMAATSANAATYFARIDGVVTSKFETPFTLPGAASPISVGDRMTAVFSYSDSMAGGPGSNVGRSLMQSLAHVSTSLATFTIGDFTWTSRGDFLGVENPLLNRPGTDPLDGYYSTMDDAKGGGDLDIANYTFEIGEFGYDLYQGYGYRGVFDRASLAMGTGAQRPQTFQTNAVPESATWMLMITGFAIAGAGLRSRQRGWITRRMRSA